MLKLAIDLGFGDSKIAINRDGEITWTKETNAITKLGTKSEDVVYSGKEKNVVLFKDQYYLVGKSALQYPDAHVMDIMNYDSIKAISPIIAKKYITEPIENYDMISFTLSSAFRKYSADYREYISTEFGIPKDKLRIIPQGAGCKLAIDNIGLDLSNPSRKNSSYKNYLIVDIGFNTIDVSTVIDGSLMPADIKGYEQEGVVQVAMMVKDGMKTKYGVEISIPRARSLIYDKILKVKSTSYDATQIIEDAIDNYLTQLNNFLEKYYGDLMNTISNVILFGGGAEIIRSHKDKWEALYGTGFMLMPVTDAEYYNAVGALY